MSKLIVYMSMSLDGYIAAEGDDRPGLGLGVGGEPLHDWLAEDNRDPASPDPGRRANARVLAEMMSSGAVIAGRRSLELAHWWGGDHHDDVPIYVLTHDLPEQTVDGNFRYVDDPGQAVAEAKRAAGDRDVMMHGAAAVQAMLALDLVDELAISVAPILLHEGRRLFDDRASATTPLRLVDVAPGHGILHLRYALHDPAGAHA